MIGGDILVSFQLYFIIKNYSNPDFAVRAFRFWMFSPFTIILSSIWGMFDQLALVFVLASVIILHSFKSIPGVTFSALLKGLPIIFLPIFAFHGRSLKKAAVYMILSTALFVSSTLLPYVVFKSWNINGLLASGTDTIHKVGNAMNYWVVFSAITMYYKVPDTLYSFLRLVAYAWIPALILSYFLCIKYKGTMINELVNSSLFVLLIFFLSAAQVNEQYATYSIAFGLIDLGINGGKGARYFKGLWISSTLYMIVNNVYLLRFFSPIFVQENNLEKLLTTGTFGLIRTALLIIFAFSFTYFCIKYLLLCYRRFRKLG
jgi:Gpi18-like mannosyltransferase